MDCCFSWKEYVGLNSLTISDTEVLKQFTRQELRKLPIPLSAPCSLYPVCSTFFWVSSAFYPFKSFHHVLLISIMVSIPACQILPPHLTSRTITPNSAVVLTSPLFYVRWLSVDEKKNQQNKTQWCKLMQLKAFEFHPQLCHFNLQPIIYCAYCYYY